MLPESAKLKLQDDIKSSFAYWGNSEGDLVKPEAKPEYRYTLMRIWNYELPRIVFIGLNPSVADENFDDRTVRKCINFARKQGGGSLMMLNIFAFRSTNAEELLTCLDPVGKRNNQFISGECLSQSFLKDYKIFCAWGTGGKLFNRGDNVVQLLKGLQLSCLGINNDGSPKHPLYLPYDSTLRLYGV